MKLHILTLLSALTLFVSSCSQKSAVLEVVPTDVDVVVVSDLKATAEAYGINFESDNVVFPKGFPSELITPEVHNVIVTANKSLDLSCVVMFAKAPTVSLEPMGCVVIAVTDADEFGRLITDTFGATKTDGGYSLSAHNNVIIEDGLAWFTPGDADDVKAILKSAADNAFFSSKIASVQKPEGLATFYLNTSYIANLAGHESYFLGSTERMVLSTAADYLSGKWVIVTGDIKGEECIAHAVACDSEGQRIEVPFLKSIDSDFLSCVPKNFDVVLAGALDSDALGFIQNLYQVYGASMLPYELRTLSDKITNLINGIDGNFFMACDFNTFATSKGDTFNWMVGIELNSQARGDALSALGGILANVYPSEYIMVLPGSIKLALPYSPVITISISGDYLVATTASGEATGNTQLKSYLGGHLLAFGANIPNLSVLGSDLKSCDLGIDLGAYLDTKSFTFTAKYSKPLSEILVMIAKSMNEASVSYDSYDYYDRLDSDTLFEVVEAVEAVEVDSIAY